MIIHPLLPLNNPSSSQRLPSQKANTASECDKIHVHPRITQQYSTRLLNRTLQLLSSCLSSTEPCTTATHQLTVALCTWQKFTIICSNARIGHIKIWLWHLLCLIVSSAFRRSKLISPALQQYVKRLSACTAILSRVHLLCSESHWLFVQFNVRQQRPPPHHQN